MPRKSSKQIQPISAQLEPARSCKRRQWSQGCLAGVAHEAPRSSCKVRKETNANQPTSPPWKTGADVKRIEFAGERSPGRLGRAIRSKEFAKLASQSFPIDLPHYECHNPLGKETPRALRSALRRPGKVSPRTEHRISWNDCITKTSITSYMSPEDVGNLWCQDGGMVECNNCERKVRSTKFCARVGAPGRSSMAQWWMICKDCAAKNPFLNLSLKECLHPPKQTELMAVFSGASGQRKMRRFTNTSEVVENQALASCTTSLCQPGVGDGDQKAGFGSEIGTTASVPACVRGSVSASPKKLSAQNNSNLSSGLTRILTRRKPAPAV